MMKEDIVKMMEKHYQKFLIKMVQELPENLTQIVMTQIDPEDFAKIIAKDFQNILKDVVLFTN